MHCRAGAALLEVLVAAVVSSILLAIAILLLETQGDAARSISRRSEQNDATRSAIAALRAELRELRGTDIHAIARDSISSRIFRGLAVVCGFNGSDVFARYQGLRLPVPAKDSALQLGPENVVAIPFVRVDTTACTRYAGEQILALRWSAPPRVGSAWLIFETGGYHINANALRYREVGSTRQPITNAVFDDVHSAFAAVSDTVLRGIDVGFRDLQMLPLARTRLHFLNAR